MLGFGALEVVEERFVSNVEGELEQLEERCGVEEVTETRAPVPGFGVRQEADILLEAGDSDLCSPWPADYVGLTLLGINLAAYNHGSQVSTWKESGYRR